MTDEFKDPLSTDRSGRDEMDDILGGGDFFKEEVKPPKSVEPVVNINEPVPNANETKAKDGIPQLRGDNFPPAFIKMAERIQAQYVLLPNLDYDALYDELKDLSVEASPTPTLQVLNDELCKVQGAKDRLSEILVNVIKSYNYKNRAVDILKDSWGKYTEEKNTEGRKGDATFRMSEFMEDFAKIEALSKVCNHVLKNLDSLHDNLSRRITVWQLIIKLRDIGRGGLPDYDMDKKSDGSQDGLDFLSNDEEKGNKSEGGPEEINF